MSMTEDWRQKEHDWDERGKERRKEKEPDDVKAVGPRRKR